MEAAGVWKAPGRRPPAPGPSHTPWKSWAPAHPPPRIPTSSHSRDDEVLYTGKEDKKKRSKPTTSTNMSRRSSLRSDGWSPSIGTGGRFRRNPHIYINRLLRHWRKTGASERLGQIVSYADDFVIVCASRRQAEESLALVSHWLKKLGLAIHPTKTRLCHAREEPFDFLGYTFGPTRHWQTGRRFLSAWPSKKAQRRLKEKINALLFRGNPAPWPELQARLNRLLSGWAEYFSFGHTGQADEAIGWHVRARVRRFLCRRHKLRVRGTSRFGYVEVHEKMGVVDLHRRRLRRRPAHALS